MAFYESIFILRQDIQTHDVLKISDKFIEIAYKFGANHINKEYWGLRSLAYVVKKNKKGHYILLRLNAPPETIKELERNYKINEDVIKYLTLKVDQMSEDPTLMMQAPSESSNTEETIR